MKIKIDIAALGRSKWYEYLVRFVFGGIITAVAGIIAKRCGPEIGGLFLAFPAIFPATATLIERHERQKKERAGKQGTMRARAAAGLDAAGAAMGSIGLLAFGFIVWRWMAAYAVALVLGVATFAWLLVAVLTWEAREVVWKRVRVKLFDAAKHSGSIAGPEKSLPNRRLDE